MADWKKIKAEYIRGRTSYKKLAEKYGVSFSTIQKRGADEKWTDLKKKSGRKADEKIVESISSREASRVDTYNRISDKLLGKIESGIDDGSLILTPRGYNDLTAAIKTLRDIHDIKSDRDIREQEARIEKLRKDVQKDEENNDIRVIITGDVDEFAK